MVQSDFHFQSSICLIHNLYFSGNVRISEDDYVKAIKEEISKVVKLQEELDIDVLVHGEPEVRFRIIWIFEAHLCIKYFF